MDVSGSPKLVKQYEYSYYDLQTPLNDNVANNNRQTKDNYLFSIDNSREANPIDWYNAYVEVNLNSSNILMEHVLRKELIMQIKMVQQQMVIHSFNH